jgi:hypothetical protein
VVPLVLVAVGIAVGFAVVPVVLVAVGIMVVPLVLVAVGIAVGFAVVPVVLVAVAIIVVPLVLVAVGIIAGAGVLVAVGIAMVTRFPMTRTTALAWMIRPGACRAVSGPVAANAPLVASATPSRPAAAATPSLMEVFMSVPFF